MSKHDKLISILMRNKERAIVNDKGEAIGFGAISNRLIYLNTEKKGCAIPVDKVECDKTWVLVHREDLNTMNDKSEKNVQNSGMLELGDTIIWFSPEQLVIQTENEFIVKEIVDKWIKHAEPKR